VAIFKGFQDTSRAPQFRGFPNLNHQMNNEAYGFSGVIGWWDAAFGTDTITNGASVNTWKDRISSRVLTGVASNLPLYTLSDANFNNLPSIKFSGTKTMTFDTPFGLPSNFTLAIVYKIIALSSIRNSFMLTANGGDSPIGLDSASSNGERVQDAFGNVFSASVNSTAKHISILSPTDIYRDGASVASGGTIISCDSGTQIGNTSSARQLNTDVAEFIFFGQKLSTTQMAELSAKLNTKYAIY
jgi:hypothetical protein